MRILSITAGAGGMYCGSCLRDNALAAELLARGLDVTLLPLYTPTRTDEPNVSRPRVLLGGINLYLQQRSRLVRRAPRLLDRLLDSPTLLKAFAGRAAATDPRVLGDLTVSILEGIDGVLRREFGKLIDWLHDEPAPDIVNLPNSLLIALARPIAEALDRPVVCTLQGEDLFLDGLPPAHRAQALGLIGQHLPHVQRFIAVSEYYSAYMSRYLQIPADRMALVPLGVNMAGHVRRSTPAAPDHDMADAPPDDVFRVGYLARVAPEKGLHVLASAFERLCRRTGPARVRLEAAGYLAPAHRQYLADVQRSLERAGLGRQFVYRGTLDRAGKLDHLRRLDVLSVPATYDEPKGMFLLEAMASGVPVVEPRRGAFTEIVQKTGGGLLVDPDDPEALADGLHTVWRDAVLRDQLGRRAFDGVRAHYTVQQAADRLLNVYEDVLTRVHLRSAFSSQG